VPSRGTPHSRCGSVELAHTLLHVAAHAVDVVVDAIQHRALVNDEGRQILEELGQLGDGACNLVDLAVARGQVQLGLRLRRLFLQQQLALRAALGQLRP
jgi:hypothetical protein